MNVKYLVELDRQVVWPDQLKYYIHTERKFFLIRFGELLKWGSVCDEIQKEIELNECGHIILWSRNFERV